MKAEQHKVLLVEDNPGDARLFLEYIIDSGQNQFDVHNVKTLEETFVHLAEEKFDLILLDLSLPDSRGFETFTEIRSRADDIPIIVLTGLDDESLAIKAVHGGAQDYLVKGDVDSTLLVRSMRYAIERHNLQKEIESTREEFLALLVHDLKSPIVAIKGFTELLAAPGFGEISEKKLRFVKMIRRSVDMIFSLINNIVDATRIDAGYIKPDLQNFPLSDMLKDLENTFMPQTLEKKISLDFSYPKGTLINADLGQISQVFHNLLSNAVRYTPEGGKIWISVKSDNGRIAVEVGDTGKGIPESKQPALFDKYSKVKSDEPGTGLGLYIVKKLLEAHGSDVTVVSAPGKGTRFFFSLPAGIPISERPILQRK